MRPQELEMNFTITRRVAVALIATIALSGCYMRVRISGGEDGPDGKLRAGIVAHTAPGEGYDERKRKDVYVSIYRTGVEPTNYLFKAQFSIVASELDWKIHWSTTDQVDVRFFERKAPDTVLKGMTISRNSPSEPFTEVR
jgi:hypothetical protein